MRLPPRQFARRYGDDVYELEAVEPSELQTILRKAIDCVADAAVPIAMEQAEAREKLWTPEKEREAAGSLWIGAFDTTVISGRIGMRKPDAEIFHHTAELLGLRPDQCVMVDDLRANIQGAVAAGMTGVLHESFEQTREELAILFALDLG